MEDFLEYDMLGRRVIVGSPVPEARTALHQLFRGFGPRAATAPTGGDLPRYELTRLNDAWYVHGEEGPLHADHDLVAALGALEWHLMTAALNRHHDQFHLHGAALATPAADGAIVLVGQSGSGKSTLTLALMQRGFLPFSDDAALIDPRTRVVRALPRAFHISDDSLRLVEACAGQPVPAGGEAPAGFFHPPAWAAAPLPVRWLLLLELRPDQEPALARLAPAGAAAALLDHALNLPQAPGVGLAAVARLTADAGCYRFQHGNLPASLATLERLVT